VQFKGCAILGGSIKLLILKSAKLRNLRSDKVRNLRSIKVRNLRSDELRNLRGVNYITHFRECQSAEFTKYLSANCRGL